MHLKIGEIGSHGAKVFLDGEERTYVVEANEKERYIVRYRTDEQGKPMLDAARENIMTEKMRGDVRIELDPKDAWARAWQERHGREKV